MKKVLEGILLVAAIEAFHCVLFTGLLCLLGFFTRPDGSSIRFRQLLWEGGVAFWFDGYGAILMLCLLVFVAWVLLDFFADRGAIEERRKNMDKEIVAAAQRLMDANRPKMEASIRAACEREFAGHKQYLAGEENRLSMWQWELGRDRQQLDADRASLEDAKGKIGAWKTELAALRKKAEADKERRLGVKQRIQWAQNALQEEPSNVGLALRHLRMAGKG